MLVDPLTKCRMKMKIAKFNAKPSCLIFRHNHIPAEGRNHGSNIIIFATYISTSRICTQSLSI